MGERGVALVAVLWLLALVAAVAAHFTMAARSEVGFAADLGEAARARHLADAGVAVATARLVGGARPPVCPDGRSFAVAFDGETIAVAVRDEAGKVDLNEAPEALLRGLFVAAGLSGERAAALAAAVADWRDGDSRLTPGGAEAADYRAAGRPAPKNAPFEAIEEFASVLGVTDDVYERVRGDVTVHSHVAGVDAAAASALVLRALPEVSAELADAYVAAREALPVCAALPPLAVPAAQPYLVASPRIAFAIAAEVRLDGGVGARREAVIGLGSSAAQPFLGLAWRTGVLAATAPSP